MKVKNLLHLVLVFCLLTSFAFILTSPVNATGANWLTGWLYRKSHVINNAAGSGAGYQVQIKVYKGSGADGTETVDGIYSGKVYCSGNCLDDFGDIRFTDDDGSTELSYWIEDTTLSSGSSAVFWVKVADDLTTNPQTIYIYYGKAGATTTSNLYFTGLGGSDDFNTGSSPNSTTWTVTGSPTISSGIVTCTMGTSIYSTATTGAYSLSFHSRYQYEGASVNQIGQTGWGDAAGNNGLLTYNGEVEYWRCLKSGGSTTAAQTSSKTTWYYMDFFWVSSSNATFWLNGVSKATVATNVPITALPTFLYSRASYGCTVDSDFIMVRKFTNGAEPAHGAWGSKEVSVYVIVYFNHNSSDGCYTYLITESSGMSSPVTNGTAYATLTFNMTATCNGSSFYYFANFTYVDWSNSTDLNPDYHTGLTANITIWVYYALKPLPATYAIARFDFNPTNPVDSEQIVFNATQSYNTSTVSFEWDFGDANVTLVSDSFLVTHAYSANGSYVVSLTLHGAAVVDNSSFYFRTLNVSSYIPVARFSFLPNNPKTNQEVVFDASQSFSHDTILSYNWWFVDGGTNFTNWMNPKVTHTFTAAGLYNVTLTVSTGSMSNMSQATFHLINVSDYASVYLVARFTFLPTNPQNTSTVLFNATTCQNSSTITDYSWDFGDGNVTSGVYQKIYHNFAVDGNYTVSLTVTSADGANAFTFQDLVVNSASGGGAVSILESGGMLLIGILLGVLCTIPLVAAFVRRRARA